MTAFTSKDRCENQQIYKNVKTEKSNAFENWTILFYDFHRTEIKKQKEEKQIEQF